MSWRENRQRKHAAKVRREYELSLYGQLQRVYGRKLWIPLHRYLDFKPLPNGIAGSRSWFQLKL